MTAKRISRKHLLFVFGTRPEALKMAPVIIKARRNPAFKVSLCLTAQHREMVDQVMKLFGIRPDIDLNLMTQGQTLGDLTQRVLSAAGQTFRKLRPDWVLVQGDTTTAFAAALAAFYEKIPVAHIEAGLRTFHKYQPYPEEMNRVLITRLADIHFAPTKLAANYLFAERVERSRVVLTGNTVVDALELLRPNLKKIQPKVFKSLEPGRPVILVTSHRRENFGKPLSEICRALAAVSRLPEKPQIVYPVHLNPQVRTIVMKKLSGVPGIHLIPPVTYEECLSLIERSAFVLTDSGGIQEEAPSFRKPVLVLRDVSERPEGIRIGVAKLVGADYRRIVTECRTLLSDRRAYRHMSAARNPYGDGKASDRILKTLARGLRS